MSMARRPPASALDRSRSKPISPKEDDEEDEAEDGKEEEEGKAEEEGKGDKEGDGPG
jgi:hypothetical protein